MSPISRREVERSGWPQRMRATLKPNPHGASNYDAIDSMTAPKNGQPRTNFLIEDDDADAINSVDVFERWKRLCGVRPGGKPIFSAPRNGGLLNPQYVRLLVEKAGKRRRFQTRGTKPAPREKGTIWDRASPYRSTGRQIRPPLGSLIVSSSQPFSNASSSRSGNSISRRPAASVGDAACPRPLIERPLAPHARVPGDNLRHREVDDRLRRYAIWWRERPVPGSRVAAPRSRVIRLIISVRLVTIVVLVNLKMVKMTKIVSFF